MTRTDYWLERIAQCHSIIEMSNIWRQISDEKESLPTDDFELLGELANNRQEELMKPRG